MVMADVAYVVVEAVAAAAVTDVGMWLQMVISSRNLRSSIARQD